MAISNPVTVPEFQEKMRVTNISWDLNERLEVNEMQSRGVISSLMGEPIWEGRLQTRPLRVDNNAFEAEALMDLIKRGRKFLLTPPHKKYPYAYLDGSNPQGSITLTAVSASRQEVTFGGFDAGFQLTAGDLFSFTFGGRFYFHRVLETVVAAGNGSVTNITVAPAISENVTPPTATVTFDAPIIQAVYRPGTHSGQDFFGPMGSGFSFNWVQSL